jgi:hypothetical protein
MSRRQLAQRYWDAYAAGLEPPPGSAPRTLARIEQRIREGERVDDELPPVAEQPRRAAAGLVVLGKSAAVSVGIATAALLSIKLAAVGWSQLAGGTPAPEDPAAERRASARHEEAAVAPVVPEPPSTIGAYAETVVGPTPAVPDVEPRASEPSRRGASPAIVDQLRAEVALMDRARVALEQGDAQTLLRLTSEHARRFPAGALVEEREAWQAIVACRLGHAGASAQAERFLRAHPRSAQADKLRRACENR